MKGETKLVLREKEEEEGRVRLRFRVGFRARGEVRCGAGNMRVWSAKLDGDAVATSILDYATAAAYAERQPERVSRK